MPSITEVTLKVILVLGPPEIHLFRTSLGKKLEPVVVCDPNVKFHTVLGWCSRFGIVSRRRDAVPAESLKALMGLWLLMDRRGERGSAVAGMETDFPAVGGRIGSGELANGGDDGGELFVVRADAGIEFR